MSENTGRGERRRWSSGVDTQFDHSGAVNHVVVAGRVVAVPCLAEEFRGVLRWLPTGSLAAAHCSAQPSLQTAEAVANEWSFAAALEFWRALQRHTGECRCHVTFGAKILRL